MTSNATRTTKAFGYSLRLGTIFVLLAAIIACGPNVELPPLADVDTSQLLTDVASQLDANKKQVDRSPKNAKVNGNYGLVLSTYGRDEAADIAFQRARLLEPDEAKWAFYHAFVLRRLGKTDDALAAVDAGLAARPDQIDLLVKRGELLHDLARFDEAEVELEKALAVNSTYPLAQYYMGRINIQRQEWPEAKNRFEKMLRDGIKVNEVHFNLATVYRMLGNPSGAQQQLNLSNRGSQMKIAGFDPVNMLFDKLNVGDQPHVLRAAQYYHSGNVESAIAELEIAHTKNPENLGTRVNLIRMYGHNKQIDEAIQHYEFVKAADPEFNQLQANMGFAYQTIGNHELAAEAYREAVEDTPDNAGVHAELGFALGKIGQVQEGTEHLYKSLELKPANRDLRFILGETLLKQRRFPEAIEMYQSALTPEDQKTIVVLRSLAGAHVLTSNKEAALESLNAALELANRFSNDDLAGDLKNDIERVKFSSSKNN